MQLKKSIGYKTIQLLLKQKKFKPFAFQEEAWQKIIDNKSGLVNAPTGCGKTFAVFLGAIIQFIDNHPKTFTKEKNNGLQLLWVTPLKALAKDISRAMEEIITALDMQWKIAVRNGDTTMADRQKQKKQMPEILIITPESLHLLLAQKNYTETFKTLEILAVDEWHELMGGKRGVQIELAITRILAIRKKLNKTLSVWGISATIGNLEEAAAVLLSAVESIQTDFSPFIVKAEIYKKIEINSILPDEIEKFPWAGHLGISLIDKIIPIIENSTTTLIFINTRGMTEMWYQGLLNANPELAGAIAIHHGSIEQALRLWVEEALHTTALKVVVCTASLDLGVDFRPVETIIQVGSPKGIARFLQRAGRSGHQPDAVSKIYFLPTHSLELMEAVALKKAVENKIMESKDPIVLCYDVLVQYLCTLAISDGFNANEIFNEIKNTFCFKEITKEEYDAIISYITQGGKALQEYDEYKKVTLEEDGLYKIKNRRTAMQHRMHIGTIVSDVMLKVKFMGGGYIGVIEEWFISKLKIGDVFTLAGRNIEILCIKDMTVTVKKSTAKKSIIPSWMGGRMSLTANLGKLLREVLNEIDDSKDIEIQKLQPLFTLQKQMSYVPKANELLIEHIETKDGFHLFVYPFEGRLVHEAMATILAYRLSKIVPITFSIAMNDYGFELLSDLPIPLDDGNVYELFSITNLFEDIQRSVNSTEMAKRKFRDIAVIGGLIFQGYPGEQKKARHLQSSASLLYKVFTEYEPNNLLLKQAYTEVYNQQMEEVRLRDMLKRIAESNIIITYPKQLTPFCFPIKVDSIRENMSSEKLMDRVRKMKPK
jgi:ATP-dependent helicase Lhr and Lhr-like helicase